MMLLHKANNTATIIYDKYAMPNRLLSYLDFSHSSANLELCVRNLLVMPYVLLICITTNV